MNNKDFQDTYFPLSEAVENSAFVVERLKKDIADIMGSDVEDIGFAVDRILEVREMDPTTESGQRYLAGKRYDDAEDVAEFTAYIVESIDLV